MKFRDSEQETKDDASDFSGGQWSSDAGLEYYCAGYAGEDLHELANRVVPVPVPVPARNRTVSDLLSDIRKVTPSPTSE